ncbi:MAG: hypothetical protein R2874_15350 [Desulfobacterales bacterium]
MQRRRRKWTFTHRPQPETENLPLMAALVSVWNNNFLGYPAQGLIPMLQPCPNCRPTFSSSPLESNGKSVTETGKSLGISCGTIVRGTRHQSPSIPFSTGPPGPAVSHRFYPEFVGRVLTATAENQKA